MPNLIQVDAAYALSEGASPPEWVMWMPGGKHSIRAHKNGVPSSLTITVTEAHAAKLQTELAAKTGPKAYIGFDHKPGARASIPLEFAWKTEPKPGIYCKCQWTPDGKKAVTAADGESANYGYFSPTFMADDAGEVLGLTATGEIGSLTNDPAFRDILPVAASQSQPAPSMNEDEIKALQADKKKAEDELAALKKTTAAAAVAKAVSEGRIAAQNTKAQDFWTAQLIADPKNIDLLNEQPAVFAAKGADVGGQMSVNAGQEPQVNGTVVRARAQDLYNASRSQGRCTSWQQCFNTALAEADALPSTSKVTAAA